MTMQMGMGKIHHYAMLVVTNVGWVSTFEHTN
jgi:hypothetical protein